MKLKKYIDCYVPIETCNLRCHYCYITQQRKFNNKLADFPHGPGEIRRALSVNRLGGTCLLNLCAGGETLLGNNVIDVIRALLEEGHFLTVVTNGTLTNRFEELSKFPRELRHRLFIKFSFHYLELLRTRLLETFFVNIDRMRRTEISFTVEITPSDELIPHIGDIKELSLQKMGTLPHVTIARDDRTRGIEVLSKHPFGDYQKIWSSFESGLFQFKSSIFYQKRKEFCYAGDWSLYANLVSGNVSQCYCGRVLDNLFENPTRPLKTGAIGNHCPLPHCYNGHAFLTLGTIPELETPTYAEMRDRVDSFGRHWLQPAMMAFMKQKLEDHNTPYSKTGKVMADLKSIAFSLASGLRHGH